MTGTKTVIDALKTLLKQSGITYAKAAVALDLSEASVKRLFAEQSFTLSRIETLCDLAGSQLTDLIRLADDQQERLQTLTEDQEKELVGNMELLVVAICVLNRFRFSEVLKQYQFEESQLQRLFVRLDRLGIIELQPANRYRLNVSRSFRWLANGPIQRFFTQSIISNFLDKRLIGEHDQFRFAWGTLSDESIHRVLERLSALAEEFNDAADRDAQLSISQRTGSGLMIAFRRDWEPKEFNTLRREPRV